jgi:uncharacterized membrane protein
MPLTCISPNSPHWLSTGKNKMLDLRLRPAQASNTSSDTGEQQSNKIIPERARSLAASALGGCCCILEPDANLLTADVVTRPGKGPVSLRGGAAIPTLATPARPCSVTGVIILQYWTATYWTHEVSAHGLGWSEQGSDQLTTSGLVPSRSGCDDL